MLNMLSIHEHSAQQSCGFLADFLVRSRLLLATAESCTGGLIAAACTDLAGSSLWFDRGFVTYSNAAKSQQLGVSPDLIAAHGAVSEPVARAMAFGAIRHSQAQISIAVTGIAGPAGGSADKPVGRVWFGFSVRGGLYSETRCFQGDRAAVRSQTTQLALSRLVQLLRQTDA
jgi:nicotinamide-nucleotide amidase